MKSRADQSKLVIDDTFVDRWHALYDDSENDEGEYREILNEVSEELDRNQTLTKSTFERILDWKSPRLKGIVRLQEFPSYAKGILG